MSQFLDQCLRLLQIFRIKPFGEPVVDVGEHAACCVLRRLDCAEQLSLMLLVPLGEGKQTIDRFYQGLSATRFKIDGVTLRAHQRTNTSNRHTHPLTLKPLGNSARAHTPATFRAGGRESVFQHRVLLQGASSVSIVQSSQTKPEIRSKSLLLRVTRQPWLASVIAAIRKSWLPTRRRCRFNSWYMISAAVS